jgi:hypothetical protein
MQIQRDYGIYSLLVTRDGYCAMFHASVELNKTFLYCNYLQLWNVWFRFFVELLCLWLCDEEHENDSFWEMNCSTQQNLCINKQLEKVMWYSLSLPQKVSLILYAR